ncbi:MAG TPA: sucrase ferredoxin [Actinomycetota bacterium]|nr:sucrase ferredoxin [Actinomycetota bacterium]
MRAGVPRCSRRSRDLGEDQRGTASVITNWVLVEQPGPWGYRALTQSRLPLDVGEELARRSSALGLRVVLIRRHGRSSPKRRQCYVVHAGQDAHWVESVPVDAVEEILAVDWSPVVRGQPTGAGRVISDPLFLVCTNGARDPCCAERGRAVAAALAGAWDVWECSHIGGDRFAANLVCFPHGVYYGRVVPTAADGLVRAYGNGELDLDHYRGRVCYDFATQAAETFLRERWDLRRLEDVRLVGRRRNGQRLRAAFETPRGRVSLVVAIQHGDPRPLTCHATVAEDPPTYRLLTMEGPA